MAIATLKGTNGRYGTSSYGTLGDHIYIGNSYRTRITFPSLHNQVNAGTGNIRIDRMVLHLYNDQSTSADYEITVGCSSSGDWGAAQDATKVVTIGKSSGDYALDITDLAEKAADYKTNWFMHLTRSGTRVRLDGTTGNVYPYIEATWDYAANTLSGAESGVTLGNAMSFKVTNETPVAGETYTLTYAIGDASGTIATKASSPIAWTPPTSLAAEIPNATSANVQIRMTAYNSDGSVNRTEVYYQTVIVPESMAPAVTSVGASLVNDLSEYGLYGRSKIKIAPSVDMSSAGGSSLVSVDASLTSGKIVEWTSFTESEPGKYTCAEVITGTIKSKSTLRLTITATDSRGRTGTNHVDFTFCSYSLPQISGFSVERYEPVYDSNETISGYTASDMGENVWVNINASVQAIAPAGTQLNTLKWSIQAVNNSTGATVTKTGTGAQSVSIAGNKTAFPDAVGGDESWTYTLTVTDTAGGKAVAYSTVSEAHAALSVSPDKRGVAIGMIASGTKSAPKFEVADDYESHFYGGIWGEAGPRLDGVQSKKLMASDGGNMQLFDVSSRTSTSAGITVDDDDWVTLSYDNTEGTAVKWVSLYVPTSSRIVAGKTYTVVVEIKSISNSEVRAVTSDTGSNVGQFATNFFADTTGVHIGAITARADLSASTNMLRTVCRVPAGVNGQAVFRISVLEDRSVTSGNFVYTSARFSPYSSALAPRIMRVGPYVYLDGAVKNVYELASGFDGIIAVLPSGLRPVTDISVIQQGRTYALWRMLVRSNGEIRFQGNRSGASAAACAAGTQLPLTARWIAADAY